jgi:hypothetical protein
VIEESARKDGLSHEQRLVLRQEVALPVWKDLVEWLGEQYAQVLPKSQIGQAIAYSLRRKEALGRYLTNGKLEIDNNLVENVIRPVAIGRKNYLFAGNHEAAQRNAMIYTLIHACKLHGVNPEVWLEEVLGGAKPRPEIPQKGASGNASQQEPEKQGGVGREFTLPRTIFRFRAAFSCGIFFWFIEQTSIQTHGANQTYPLFQTIQQLITGVCAICHYYYLSLREPSTQLMHHLSCPICQLFVTAL